MKRIQQTERGWQGNCTAACLASIFEADIADVPKVAEYGVRGDGPGMFRAINDWLQAKYGVVMCQMSPEALKGRPVGYWIATTKVDGRDDFTHATVWFGERMIWNPTPGASQNGDDLGELVAVNFFVVTDPATLYTRGYVAGFRERSLVR